jgi:inner membrane protein
LLPNEISPLWSIELQPDAGRWDHALYRTHRDTGTDSASLLWEMMTRP